MGAPSAQSILSLIRLPGRLNVEQAAAVLGFTDSDIVILMKAGVLKPLGNPPPNGQKVFARNTILELADDPDWLDKATKVVIRHWRTRNQRSQSLVNVG